MHVCDSSVESEAFEIRVGYLVVKPLSQRFEMVYLLRVRLLKGSHMTDLTKSQTTQQPVSVDSSADSLSHV